MKRSILCCSLALLASGSAWAEITPPTVDADALLAITQQEKTVTGTVVDANGEPIIGANVVVKGTTTSSERDYYWYDYGHGRAFHFKRPSRLHDRNYLYRL